MNGEPTLEELERYNQLCLKLLDRWQMTRADYKEYERLDWKIRIFNEEKKNT